MGVEEGGRGGKGGRNKEGWLEEEGGERRLLIDVFTFLPETCRENRCPLGSPGNGGTGNKRDTGESPEAEKKGGVKILSIRRKTVQKKKNPSPVPIPGGNYSQEGGGGGLITIQESEE